MPSATWASSPRKPGIVLRAFITLLVALLLAAAPVAAAPFAPRVLARIPKPGSVTLTTLGRAGTIYGATYHSVTGNAGDGRPSQLFAWAPDGTLLSSWVIAGQDLDVDHGVQVAAVDGDGYLVLLETSRAQVLRFDPRNGHQSVEATLPDVPPCRSDQDPVAASCSQTREDAGPAPDYAAFGPDGTLYVDDTEQATVFAIAPGGGRPRVWLSDARFDSFGLGLTGLALRPDGRALMLSTGLATPTVGLGSGELLSVPIGARGEAGRPQVIWRSGPAEGPDGFAIARSGDIFLALLGLTSQIVELSSTGSQKARFPDLAANQISASPFDGPSSVTYDGERLLITNSAYFTGQRGHQVLFAVDSGQPGARPFIPPPSRTHRKRHPRPRRKHHSHTGQGEPSRG